MKYPITMLVLVSVLAGVAMAQPPWAGQGAGCPNCDGAARMMQRIDTDGDGKVSLAEHSARGEARFKRLDSNGDGMLSKEEFLARSNQRFKEADADGNGFVTWEERRQMRMKRFRKWRQGPPGQGRPMVPVQ